MKWLIAKLSDLKDSWSPRDIIAKKESEGYCCHYCAQVKTGKPPAQFKTPGLEKSKIRFPVCSEECRQRMLYMEFDEVTDG